MAYAQDALRRRQAQSRQSDEWVLDPNLPAQSNGLNDRGQEGKDREVPLLMPEERRIDVIAVVASLKDRLETIRCSEMKRIRGQIGRLSPEQEVAIESLTHGLVNNIINAPVSTLEKVTCDADASAVIDIVMRLFDLHPERHQSDKVLTSAV